MENVKTFYFTYGTAGMPFSGGWTEIVAPSFKTAHSIFRAYHPDEMPGVLNCSSVYTEEEFQKSIMAKEGNFGYRCHERITVTREVFR